MANEATVFSMTTTNGALDDSNQIDANIIGVSTENAAAMTASVDLGLYFLKSKYESADGRSKLLRQLELIKAKIIKGAWPAI